MTLEGEFQGAVRDVVLEVTGRDDRVSVTHTQATLGWGDILFVDVYSRHGEAWREELEPVLRKAVAGVTDHPHERVAVRWRIST